VSGSNEIPVAVLITPRLLPYILSLPTLKKKLL